ncbi:calcium-binding protein [Epibacterium ulvae]|uniref:calcium-binding protein n=1 Tax=Epibacterium ulvae TaxID=1156985 RepID=UPI002490EC51|nr:calcium-binding protein [Epibacterium ulvae]
MTTYTVDAIFARYDDFGDIIDVTSGSVSAVTQGRQNSFSYSTLESFNGISQIQFDVDSFSSLNFSSSARLDPNDIFALISEIETDFGTSTVLILSFLQGSVEHEYTIVLDGAEIPVPSSPAAFEQIGASISSFSIPDGAFSDGIDIRYSSLQDVETTQNDLFQGTGFEDRFNGGRGNDRLIGFGGDDVLFGGLGRDRLVGNTGRDELNGGAGRDRLLGGGGNDTLAGGNGNDAVIGGAGRDVLNGGAGNDLLVGGRGLDTFVFRGRFGSDVVRDFNANQDGEDIDLSAVGTIRNFNDLSRNHIEQVGNEVVIDALNGNTITLRNVQLDDLDAGDFIF